MRVMNLAALMLILVVSARADLIETFSFDASSGNVNGIITGTLDLPFVSAGGTASGAADSLVLTSIPAGFGILAGGDNVTNWADQVTNIFTVTAGTITSFEFLAVTGPDHTDTDLVCLNSTGGPGGSIGGWDCPAGINELSATVTVYGYNSAGLGGVTFTSSAVPEPSSGVLLLTALIAVAFVARRRIVPA